MVDEILVILDVLTICSTDFPCFAGLWRRSCRFLRNLRVHWWNVVGLPQ